MILKETIRELVFQRIITFNDDERDRIIENGGDLPEVLHHRSNSAIEKLRDALFIEDGISFVSFQEPGFRGNGILIRHGGGGSYYRVLINEHIEKHLRKMPQSTITVTVTQLKSPEGNTTPINRITQAISRLGYRITDN